MPCKSKPKKSQMQYLFTYSTSTFWKRRGKKGKVKRAYKLRKNIALNAVRNAGTWTE